MRTTAYASFSLFGLYFTFITGFLLVLASYLLEPIFTSLHERKGYKQHEHLEWTANSTLQLQRLAHQEVGSGTWSGCTKTVPTTKTHEMLRGLDITDLENPVIIPPIGEKNIAEVTKSSAEHTYVATDTMPTRIVPDPDSASDDRGSTNTESNASDSSDLTIDQAYPGSPRHGPIVDGNSAEDPAENRNSDVSE